jgi:hypothetical protein
VRFEIIKSRIRRWRLTLAQAVAPVGVDVHDPDDTFCPTAQDILEAAFFSRLHADADGVVRMDVGPFVDEAVGAGLVVRKVEDGCTWYELTGAGEQELAKLWGPNRVPPWSGGYYSCAEHGVYDVHPGELSDQCPSCAFARAFRGAAGRAPWWSRIALRAADR